MLKIIKDYFPNDDQFTMKTAVPQNKFLDLVNLVLKSTWHTFNSQFINKLMVLQRKGQHLQPLQKFILQTCEQTAIPVALHPSKVWEQFADDIHSVLKHMQLENLFYHINSLHQNIEVTMEEKVYNRELVFLDTLLKHNGKISILVYKKPKHTDKYQHYHSHCQTSYKEKVVCFIEHIPLSPIRMT